jgi:hypothetical protein
VLRLYPGRAASLEESLQALVPESADHKSKCNRWRYGLQEAEPTTITGRQQAMKAAVDGPVHCEVGRHVCLRVFSWASRHRYDAHSSLLIKR